MAEQIIIVRAVPAGLRAGILGKIKCWFITTAFEGVFVAGDVRDSKYRQAILRRFWRVYGLA